MSNLSEDTITFGKYKDLTLSHLLRDRQYCAWLLKQEWFCKQYEYLYNRVKEHSPKKFFVLKSPYKIDPSDPAVVMDFVENYEYFHLCPLRDLKIPLTENEKKCYEYYLETIRELQEKIINNIGSDPNPFNIKAPSSWLNKFEKKYGISRDIFKEFLTAYDLPNLPYIVEDIKKMGGIDYKGAKSFIIAKQKSLEQEKYWETILKSVYGEDVGTQYKFSNCFFDFIHIKTNVVYECKLGLKDFNEEQHNKYLMTLGHFSLIYLIGTDCIVNLDKKQIYTTNFSKYRDYVLNIPIMKDPSKFDNLIASFTVEEISRLQDYLV